MGGGVGKCAGEVTRCGNQSVGGEGKCWGRCGGVRKFWGRYGNGC